MKPCPVCDAPGAGRERVLNEIVLLRCGVCGMVFADLPDERIEAANREVFESAAAGVYDERQSRLDELWFDSIAGQLAGGRSHGRVLDVGCGNGVLLGRFLDRGWSAHGVDFSSWAEPFARRLGFALHVGTLESLALSEGSFDAVTSTSTLEHVARPREHVREILRVLTPGGLAYLGGIPNYGSLSVRLGLSAFAHNRPPLHVNYFTRRSLAGMLAAPELAAWIGKVRVSTYGIPELHQLLDRLRAPRDHRRRRVLERGPATRRAGTSRTALRDGLAARLVAMYHYAGRPLAAGDKLEVVIRKRD